MIILEELQQALDNRPAWLSTTQRIWFEDFARKFAAYRAEQEKKDKQLSDLMKRQPLPEAFRWISDFKSQYQHWTKKLKELLEK